MGLNKLKKLGKKVTSAPKKVLKSTGNKVSRAVKSVGRTVKSAGKTTANIVKKTGSYANTMRKDLGSASVQQLKGVYDLKTLFNKPGDYVKGITQPVLGDGVNPGLWDKYGGWLAPTGIPYLIGEGIDTVNDYYYTGDESMVRNRVGRAGANYAGGQLGTAATQGMSPGYLQTMSAGGIAGGSSSALRGDDSDDILRNAGVGAASAGMSRAVGGGRQTDPVTGKVTHMDVPNSLNLGMPAGNFGSLSVGLYDSTLRRKENERKYYTQLNDLMSRANRGQDLSQVNYNNETSTPEIEEQFTGTPLGGLFTDSDEAKRKAKKGMGFGGAGFASSNPQVSTSGGNTYDGQGESYYL